LVAATVELGESNRYFLLNAPLEKNKKLGLKIIIVNTIIVNTIIVNTIIINTIIVNTTKN